MTISTIGSATMGEAGTRRSTTAVMGCPANTASASDDVSTTDSFEPSLHAKAILEVRCHRRTTVDRVKKPGDNPAHRRDPAVNAVARCIPPQHVQPAVAASAEAHLESVGMIRRRVAQHNGSAVAEDLHLMTAAKVRRGCQGNCPMH